MTHSRVVASPATSHQLISDERARAALHRAAQLQAEAIERLEQQAQLRIQAQAGTEGTSAAYRREDIEAAAEEAGIGIEFIRQALLEQDAQGNDATDLPPWMDRLSVRALGTRKRSIERSRTVHSDPRTVLSAMQQIFPTTDYRLKLIDSIGEKPTQGGVLVFQVPGWSAFSTTPSSFLYAALAVGLSQLHVTLKPIPSDEHTYCQVTLRGDLRPGMRSNIWASLAFSGLGAAGAAGLSVAAALSAGAILPVTAAVAGGGLMGGAGVGFYGFGALYRHYLKKMIVEMELLLRTVDAHARTGGGFRFGDPVPESASGSLHITG